VRKNSIVNFDKIIDPFPACFKNEFIHVINQFKVATNYFPQSCDAFNIPATNVAVKI